MSPCSPSNPRRTAQAGEGKAGCVLSLLALLLAGALVFKVGPVFYSDNNLANYAGDLGTQAGVTPLNTMKTQLLSKAQELGIPEAQADGAMTITTNGGEHNGVCTIQLKYTRQVDLYGIYPLVISTDKTITTPYSDNR